MRAYIGIDPGTESMGFAVYCPETNQSKVIRIERKDALEHYDSDEAQTLKLLMSLLHACKELYTTHIEDEDCDLKAGWIERTFSVHSPIFSPLLVVMTTIIKEELGLKAVSVKHWRKVLTDKGDITKKDCIALLKKTFPDLEGKSADEIESVGIAIACAVENGEINPVKPVSNRLIRKITRKIKTKNGKKSQHTKSINGDLSQQLDVE